jgi:glucose/arabinose dehydrogenase
MADNTSTRYGLGRRTTFGVGAAVALTAFAAPAVVGAQTRTRAVVKTRRHDIAWSAFAQGLDNPWGLAFLPDGRMLVTERPGRVRLVERDGRLVRQPVAGVPEVVARGQGGLLDVVLHPGFAQNALLYLSYAAAGDGGVATRVVRARLTGDRLEDVRLIVDALPRQASGNNHFGCRMTFDRAGKLYVATGERYTRDRAQKLDDLAGKVLRLNDDGTVPADNPFVGRAGVRPEIFTWGHRNPQGLAVNPQSGAVWVCEHGPRGGDEINVLAAGENYGWPKVTHGVDYSGAIISEHKSLPGLKDPAHVWVPSIAPSGMAFCSGKLFPNWKGDVIVGSLIFRELARVTFQGERSVDEERMLRDAVGNIRDVREGPDGKLYLLVYDDNAPIVMLEPA